MLLLTIDEAWKDHLRELDDLKQAVQNASYEQKDPLLIYKFESFNLFKSMIDSNNRAVVSSLAKAHIPIKDSSGVKEAKEPKQSQDLGRLKTRKDDVPGAAIPGGASGGGQQDTATKEKKAEPVRAEKKVGRNEPCPCGSGKKYKHCHGK
jgi:preprotein translocase subunit SecA